MATFYSTYQTKQRSGSNLHSKPNRDELTRVRRVATFYYTPDDTEVNGEYVVLGQLGIPGARIVADQCKLRYSGSGTLDAKFTLQKRDVTLATATALTAITSTITAVTSATSLAAVSGAGDLPTVEDDDYLSLLLSTGASAVTLPATATIIEEVVYDAPA
jgi:hypothetical protein